VNSGGVGAHGQLTRRSNGLSPETNTNAQRILLMSCLVRYSVLQCVTVCCSVLECVTVCCSVLQCVAVCCSVLQYVECVAVCHSLP